MVLKPACQKVSTYPHGFAFASLLYPYATFLLFHLPPMLRPELRPALRWKTSQASRRPSPRSLPMSSPAIRRVMLTKQLRQWVRSRTGAKDCLHGYIQFIYAGLYDIWFLIYMYMHGRIITQTFACVMHSWDTQKVAGWCHMALSGVWKLKEAWWLFADEID